MASDTIVYMKNLILVRHAKSSYENFSTDKNRKITDIGRDRSVKVAFESKKLIDKSTVIWSSTATRAAQTAAVFSEIISIDSTAIHFTDALYTFDCTALKKVIHCIPNEIDKIIIFGHNPAFTDFINDTTDLSIDDLPTSGLVFIEFETDNWNELPKGKVTKTLFGKDL